MQLFLLCLLFLYFVEYATNMKQRTPISLKPGAHVLTTHHVLFEQSIWESRGNVYRDLRTHGAFLVDLTRAQHDFLHFSTHAVVPPVRPVAEAMFDIAREVRGIRNPVERLGQLSAELGHVSMHADSPEVADDALIVALSLHSQADVIMNMQQLGR